MEADILLIEPDDTFRKYLARDLVRNDYVCDEVSSLSAAARHLRAHSYRCIIVALDADRERGVKLARGVRARGRAHHFVGLDTATERYAREPDDPFDAIIAKPFVHEPLLETLRRLMRLDETPLIPTP